MTAQPRRYNVAIAGYGGVGKAVAEMLLERRERYRAIYNADIRLIAVCGSKAGLQSLDGLEPAALVGTPLAAGLTGEAFLRASPIDILVEAGPTDFRTGGRGWPISVTHCRSDGMSLPFPKGRWWLPEPNCGSWLAVPGCISRSVAQLRRLCRPSTC